MVEAGDNLQDRQGALESLSRILPLLSNTQRQYVIDEIFTPLFNNSEAMMDSSLETHNVDDEAGDELKGGASSDYEMEFQLKLSKAHILDVKELNREQRKFRQEQEKKRVAEEQEQAYFESLAINRQELSSALEARWADYQSQTGLSIHQSKSLLKSILFQYGTGLVKDHPIIEEARKKLRVLM